MKKMFRMLFALVMMLAIIAVPVRADEVDEDVKEARKGVLQIKLVYEDKEGNATVVGGGSGFLINEDTVLTCWHVVHINDSANYESAVQQFGEKFADNLKIKVVVRDDVMLEAKILNESASMDFSVLELEQELSNRSILKLNDKGTLSETQQVYALGFPDAVASFQNTNSYTYEDVTMADGRVTKYTESNSVKYIQHSAKLSEGYSGGPLVTTDGVVVAMNRGYVEDYNYSVAIEEVINVLKDLSIEYVPAEGGGEEPTTEEPTTEEPTTEEPTDEPETDEPETTKKAPTVDADDADEEKEGMDKTVLIVIIAVAVVVVIIIIILVATMGGKKDKQRNSMPSNPNPQMPRSGMPNGMPNAGMPNAGMPNRPMPPQPQAPYSQPQMNQPMYGGNDGAGETTVLNEGAGETTVLGGGAPAAAAKILIRVKTGERIQMTRPEFVIGKERRRVDYCVSDNNSVSRIHAKLVNRNGQLILIDMNATNGTFVNGTRLTAGQEVRLSSGDKFKLADEEFQFQG